MPWGLPQPLLVCFAHQRKEATGWGVPAPPANRRALSPWQDAAESDAGRGRVETFVHPGDGADRYSGPDPTRLIETGLGCFPTSWGTTLQALLLQVTIPGLPENRPKLFYGDCVYVRLASKPEEEEFCGMVVHAQSSSAFLTLPPAFWARVSQPAVAALVRGTVLSHELLTTMDLPRIHLRLSPDRTSFLWMSLAVIEHAFRPCCQAALLPPGSLLPTEEALGAFVGAVGALERLTASGTASYLSRLNSEQKAFCGEQHAPHGEQEEPFTLLGGLDERF